MNKKEFKKLLKKVWYFIWEDNSIWSWLVNIILAFLLILFIVYPGLGFLLTTSHPVVAVVSESMEHNMEFDAWWEKNKEWYIENEINKQYFKTFSLKNVKQEENLIEALKRSCRKYSKEKTGKKPITNINVMRI